MPNSPVHVWEVGQFRIEEYHSSDRGTSFELMEVRGGYRLTIFPHELHHIEAVISQVRSGVPALALVERRRA